MPNSLRSKLSKLRYKGQISNEEYRELTEKLNGHDKELLDKIRAEIDKARFIDKDTRLCKNALASGLEVAIQIIDKYMAESEEV